jgi:hypothetical protein
MKAKQAVSSCLLQHQTFWGMTHVEREFVRDEVVAVAVRSVLESFIVEARSHQLEERNVEFWTSLQHAVERMLLETFANVFALEPNDTPAYRPTLVWRVANAKWNYRQERSLREFGERHHTARLLCETENWVQEDILNEADTAMRVVIASLAESCPNEEGAAWLRRLIED